MATGFLYRMQQGRFGCFCQKLCIVPSEVLSLMVVKIWVNLIMKPESLRVRVSHIDHLEASHVL